MRGIFKRGKALLSLGLSIALCLLLSGCAPTPETIEDGGVDRAMTAAEQQVQATPASDAAAACAEDGRRVDMDLAGASGAVLPVRATVSVPLIDAVTEFELVRRHFDEGTVLSAFFGDGKNEAAKRNDDNLGAYWTLTDAAGAEQWLQWDNGEAHFGILYSCDEGEKAPGGTREGSPDLPVMGERDVDEALTRVMNGFSIPGIDVYTRSITPASGQHYVRAYPRYTALRVTEPRMNESRNYIKATFSVLGMTNFLWRIPSAVQNERAVQTLTLDQALEVVRAHVGTTLNPPAGRAVDEISLRHRYLYDEAKKLQYAKPVWYFHIPLYEEGYVQQSDFGAPSDIKTYTGTFVVDAQTGVVDVVSPSYGK